LEINCKYWQTRYHKAKLLDKTGKSKEAIEADQSFLKYAPPEERDIIEQSPGKDRSLAKIVKKTGDIRIEF